MSVRIDGHVVRLEGRCRLEEAETLLEALLRIDGACVDLVGCSAMHAAVVQVLLATRVSVMGTPQNPFLEQHVLPLLHDSAPAFVTG